MTATEIEQKIEGLNELRNAIDMEENYRYNVRCMVENEYNDGANSVKKPMVTVAEIAKKYPRASAYIKAEEWANGNNYTRSTAGRKAMEKIVNGQDYNEAITAMENEWNTYCLRSMLWN